MIDFMLNEVGDITLFEKKHVEKKIVFSVYEGAFARLKFNVLNDTWDNSFGTKIEFNIKNNPREYYCQIAKNRTFTKQKLLIMIKTAVGEIANNEQVGTLLQKYKCKKFDKNIKKEIEEVLIESIKTNFNDINISFSMTKINHYYYSYSIVFYENSEQILEVYI